MTNQSPNPKFLTISGARMTMVLLLLSTFYFLLSTSPVRAQSIGFSIYPPVLETVIKPGKTITQVFTIQNLSESDKIVTARVIPFIPEDEHGSPLLKPNFQPSWLSYFSLANSIISLGQPFNFSAGKTDQLVLSISIPATAKEADYYATLILSTNTEPAESVSGVTNSVVNTTIGANLLLTVNTKANPPTLVRIKDFTVFPGDILYRYGEVYFADNLSPIRFRAVAENAGRFLTKIGGLVRISKNNQAVSLQSLVPANLLAGSAREIEASPSGTITFTPHLTNFGSHKVELDTRADNSSSHSELTLVLLPLKASLGLLLGLILLITIIKITKR